ncbi:MAG: class I SAM-dependent methyltransferase [Erysipelotrichia bacterium]|nr:class I SAM-dependent methyltransferase [Erysipelotrichia bacterium]
MLKKLLFRDFNSEQRNAWIARHLADIPAGLRILDAGAGELKNKKHCEHLEYVSQDFCQYEGTGNGNGLQTGNWDTSKIDLVCDIVSISEPDSSFDVILCSEVLEHIPDPLPALKEFSRLLKPGGILILTAPFSSHVHFAPYHYCTGFSRYWYEHHLPAYGFSIQELSPNGDWFDFFHQETARLGIMSRKYRETFWPVAFILSLIGLLYFKIRSKQEPKANDMCCLGWHCIAIKTNQC